MTLKSNLPYSKASRTAPSRSGQDFVNAAALFAVGVAAPVDDDAVAGLARALAGLTSI